MSETTLFESFLISLLVPLLLIAGLFFYIHKTADARGAILDLEATQITNTIDVLSSTTGFSYVAYKPIFSSMSPSILDSRLVIADPQIKTVIWRAINIPASNNIISNINTFRTKDQTLELKKLWITKDSKQTIVSGAFREDLVYANDASTLCQKTAYPSTITYDPFLFSLTTIPKSESPAYTIELRLNAKASTNSIIAVGDGTPEANDALCRLQNSLRNKVSVIILPSTYLTSIYQSKENIVLDISPTAVSSIDKGLAALVAPSKNSVTS